jgi:hypothetical protein
LSDPKLSFPPSRPFALVVANGSFGSKLTFEVSAMRAECLELASPSIPKSSVDCFMTSKNKHPARHAV